MPIDTRGHDHDIDPDPECPVCRESVHDAEHHHCIVLTKEPPR